MPESDELRESRAASLAHQQQMAALELAEQRGKEKAELEARLAEHGRHLKALDQAIENSTKELRGLSEKVGDLLSKAVSTRTFIAGLIAAVGALGAILAATGHG